MFVLGIALSVRCQFLAEMEEGLPFDLFIVSSWMLE
jgi:hypothetical protein